ncbi:efflux RND transporter permease subunit [Amaricoccus macauensis]|uniref:efflux RND transporter permease subunit n=1 Tax=Amaricoccus macauensis TaxID=57001 RepID=UPI003C7E8C72
MGIARASIDRSVLTWLLILGCLAGGIWAFFTIGRLEDPAFTIKQAIVTTTYPGASAAQVAEEVSEPLESAIQTLGEVDTITSTNSPGLSIIEVEIQDTYDGSELPDIWSKLRAEISDTAVGLPDGVSEPMVNDTFGDVYGIFFAVTAEGFSDAEKHQIATFLRREMRAVEGVADVEVAGLPEEAIYVDPSMPLAVHQNISPDAVMNAINTSNSVNSSGHLDRSGERTIIQAPTGSESVSEIAGLTIGVDGEVVNLYDVANVERTRVEHPSQIIRFNGIEAFSIGIAGLQTENIVEVGNRVDARLDELRTEIPYGIELHPIYQQHVVVDRSSTTFLTNLAQSVTIVVAVLAVFMGWRSAVVVGSTLLLTVLGTLFFMGVFSIEMERISLGALIIAMGMLVDNAIVVAEGMQVQMLQGRSAREAAEDVGSKTQFPLLGATVIGIMAFAGIGLSPDATGEFMFSLFAVIGISLLLSWVLAITVTPLLAHYFFRRGQGIGGADAYGGRAFQFYGTVLKRALHHRWLVVGGLVGLTVACFAGFGLIKQQFFPDSNTPMFFVHYNLPQGSDINATAEDMSVIEDWLADRDEVVSVTTITGQGASRFMLTYEPVQPDPTYALLLIRTENLEQIPPLRRELDAYGTEMLPDGRFRTERLVFGPGGGAPIEVRFSGPDPLVLRELGAEAMDRMEAANDQLRHLRTDWREPELVLRPIYATNRAQTAGVTREDIAQTFAFSTDGIQTGVFREDDRLIPIMFREDHGPIVSLIDRVVFSASAQDYVSMEQVTDGFRYEIQDTRVHRRDRLPTLTVSADIVAGGPTAATVHASIRDTVEDMELPVGYAMAWGGEYENSTEAQSSLGRQLPLSLLVMVIISIYLFGALRQPLVIWLLVPMAVNGVVIGLLGTGLPFSFTALLGLLSLSGMLIKNGIVLVEEIDLVRKEASDYTEAIVTACTSRLRPVLLAAATTILGMIPLLSDAFFQSMAVTIMGGLAFASILTLIAAPVFYSLLIPEGHMRHAKT